MALGNGRIKAIGSKAGSIFCPERNHLPRQNCCQYHCYRYHLAVLRAADERHGDQVPRSPILINVCAVNFSRSWMLNCGTLPALLSVFYSKCFCCLCLRFLSSHLAFLLSLLAFLVASACVSPVMYLFQFSFSLAGTLYHFHLCIIFFWHACNNTIRCYFIETAFLD